jgi:glycosyltransferase involved in cell wall biosynthesis
MNVVYLTNIPAPYREDFHELLFKRLSKKYSVIYCLKKEPNRKWSFKKGKYKKYFLNSNLLNINNRYVYYDIGIINILNKINPKIIILNGLSIVMIFAFLWAKFTNCKVIASTDANILTEKEQKLNILQKLIRKIIYPKCDAYLGASKKTENLYKLYGSNTKKKFFTSYYSYLKTPIKNIVTINNRKFDIILCGQFIKRKKFKFAINVIHKIHHKKKGLKIKIIGDGPLKEEILSQIRNIGVNFKYINYVKPDKIIEEFSSAKLFLFPTSSDGWGVVATEACLAGTPVITCDNAGVANELIVNNYNGHVLDLNINLWSNKISALLKNRPKLKSFSSNAYEIVKKFDTNISVKNVLNAVKATNHN